MTNLHLESFGTGPAAVFVHGIFGWGLDTFPDQRALADRYRVIPVDRRGFGDSPGDGALGWPVDMADLTTLLDDIGRAHLVGHSYGAVGCLLAAGLRPERVLSLTIIEPPLFEAAAGDPAADAMIRALKPVYEAAPTLSARAFHAAWAKAGGMDEATIAARASTFTDMDWAAADASRRERWPGIDVPIADDVLRSATWPKMMLIGGKPAPAGREMAREAFRVTALAIAQRIGANNCAFEDSLHNPQLEKPARFNKLLDEIWARG